MPISLSEAFAGQTQNQPTAPAAPPGTPPAPPNQPTTPATAAAPKPVGLKIEDVFKAQPKSPSVKERLAPVAKTVGAAMKGVEAAAVQPYFDDATKWANDYKDALAQDLKAYPEGTGNQLLHSLKTANDALGYITGPIMSPVYTGLINPAKAAIARLGDLVQKHASEDAYDAQARRMGAPQTPGGQTESEFKKSGGWEVHKRDVANAVDSLQTATEALINAGTAFVPIKKLSGVSEVRSAVDMRVALSDAKSAIEPKAPELKPVSVSLDSTMGFGKIAQNVGEQMRMIPAGATRSAASVIDDMLPHAEGYAKEFLEKLNKHIDPTIQVRFKEVAGSDKNNLGVYRPEMNQIEIRAGQPSGNIIHTTVHEMVHAVTIHMMNTLLEGDLKSAAARLGRDLTAKEKLRVFEKPTHPLMQELDTVIHEARTRAAKAGIAEEFYGLRKPLPAEWRKDDPMLHDRAFDKMSPRYEFIAELFSNPKLQEFLANSEKYATPSYRFKNMLNQLGLIIGKHLGMTKPQELQLLNQSFRVGSRLIQMQTEMPGKPRGLAQIVYHNPETGETITRGDMRIATQTSEASRLTDGPGLRRARDSLTITLQQVLRAIAPETLGKNAKLAAAVVASRITEQMQRTSAWRHGSETRLKFWRGRPDMVRDFLRKFESGGTFEDPMLRQLAQRYKDWNARIFTQDTRISGLDYEPRDNYLYHVFEDSEGVSNYFTRKYGSKWGDPSFIKDRTFDLYQEAVAAGFRPRFDNPEDIMLARQHASDIAAMHTGILADLEKYGLATLKVKGGEKVKIGRDAEGRPTMNVEKTVGTTQPPETSRWRAPSGKVYWVDNKANVILENAFKSKSLWEDKGGAGTLFRGMMGIKNAIVPIRLAMSLFHPLHVTGIDIAAGWSRTAAGFMSGTISAPKAMASLLRDGFGPLYENVRDGWKVMNVWKGKVPAGSLSDADTEALKYIVEGGMIPEMSSQYRTNARQNFMKAMQEAGADFRRGKVGGFAGDTLRATWHAPWALMSAIQAPIFEHWIPALKTASYLKDVKSILARNPELEENDAARQLALRKIAKSVDNRYGEMAYNTLFWKRWIKDIAVLDTLSLGWQLGFIREYGGGAIDVGQFAAGGNKLQRIRAGQLDRPLFVAAYTTLGAATAGLMTMAMTGENPSSLLDYIAPRTGEKNQDGSEQRVNTMFYSREFAALYKHMQNEGAVEGLSKLVLNKGSGLFGLMHEWASGVNDFGQEIRDPNSDAFQKLEQTLAYTMTDLEPISMKAMQEHITDQPVKSGVLSVLGFTPAPKYLTESKTIATVRQMFDQYVAPKQTPFDKAQYSDAYKKLREAYQTGSDAVGSMLDSMSERYELSGHDQRRIIKSLNSTIPPEVRMFMRLPWQQQKQVLDQASPEERELFLPHANKEHIRNTYEAPAP